MADPRHVELLRKRIRDWNLMRVQEPRVKPDLRGEDLHAADLRQADLSAADLRQADLSEANLSWANLKEANLHEANLRRVNFHEANLRRADLSQADLRGADLLWSTGLTREQIAKAKTDQTTKLPDYLSF